ncbi:unnamed protein product, partial [Rotaria magnacalcarata]
MNWIAELVNRQTKRTPNDTAVIYDGQFETYADLTARVRKLEQRLRAHGVGTQTLVGVNVSRSIDSVVSLITVFTMNSIFVPLDPSYPAELLHHIVRDTGLTIIVTEKQHQFLWCEHQSQVRIILVQEQHDDASMDYSTFLVPKRLESQLTSIGYIIYTSGSSGCPKGVLGTIEGLKNRFEWMWQQHPFADRQDVCCHKTALNFADSLWEILGGLLQGIPLLIIPKNLEKDPYEMIELMSTQKVSRFVTVPSFLKALLKLPQSKLQQWTTLRYLTSSGEVLPLSIAKKFLRIYPLAKLLNLYGSTEVSADAIAFHISANLLSKLDDKQVYLPIGKPITNTTVYVLTEEQKPTSCGQLHIGGIGLARGYLNNPHLTTERFIDNPFLSDDERAYLKSIGRDTRLYRTGDLVRYLSDGNLQFVARVDNQVKIRGHRIELGEIESALKSVSIVEDVVVLARSLRSNAANAHDSEDKVLIAYVKIAAENLQSRAKHISTLYNQAKQTVPSYMVPSAFVLLAEFPLTPSGKIDRISLPDPTVYDRIQAHIYIEPGTEIERTVAAIWCDLLAIEHV